MIFKLTDFSIVSYKICVRIRFGMALAGVALEILVGKMHDNIITFITVVNYCRRRLTGLAVRWQHRNSTMFSCRTRISEIVSLHIPRWRVSCAVHELGTSGAGLDGRVAGVLLQIQPW